MRTLMRAALVVLFLTAPALALEGAPRPAASGQKNSRLYSHYLSAVLLERSGQLDKALVEYDRTLEINPEATLIYRQRANLHLKMGNPEKALKDAQAYAQTHADNVDALLLLANVQLFLGQNGPGKQTLEKILELDPNQPEARLSLATLVMEDDPQRAITLLKRLTELEPTNPDGYHYLGLLYQRVGEVSKSRAMFEKAVQLDPDSLPSLAILGQISEAAGDKEAAAAYYERALIKAPDNFQLRLQLIILYAQRMNLPRIEKLLEPYQDAPNPPSEISLWQGILYEQKKEWKKALDSYSRAVKALQTPDLLLRIATLHTHLNDGKNAVLTLKKITELYPDNPQYRYFLALGYVDLRKPKDALQELDSAIRLRPEFAQAHFQKGVIFDSLKKWPEAESSFLEAIRLDTASASAYNYLGYTWADRGEKLFEARRMIERALELEPDNPAFLDSLGWLNFREKNYENALRHLKTAAERLPDPVISEHLGDCYMALERPAEAAQSYAVALKLQPRNKTVRRKFKDLNRFFTPASPAKEALDGALNRLRAATYLSGLVVLQAKAGLGGLWPAGRAQGAFYYRNSNSTSAPAELLLELPTAPLAPPVVLRHHGGAKPEWTVFPPEAQAQLPSDTGDMLAAVANLLSGAFEKDFNSAGTGVQTSGLKYVLTSGDSVLRLDKDPAQVEEWRKPSITILAEQYVQTGGARVPSLLRLRWQGGRANEPALREMRIQFLDLSTTPLEDRLFQK